MCTSSKTRCIASSFMIVSSGITQPSKNIPSELGHHHGAFVPRGDDHTRRDKIFHQSLNLVYPFLNTVRLVSLRLKQRLYFGFHVFNSIVDSLELITQQLRDHRTIPRKQYPTFLFSHFWISLAQNVSYPSNLVINCS